MTQVTSIDELKVLAKGGNNFIFTRLKKSLYIDYNPLTDMWWFKYYNDGSEKLFLSNHISAKINFLINTKCIFLA